MTKSLTKCVLIMEKTSTPEIHEKYILAMLSWFTSQYWVKSYCYIHLLKLFIIPCLQ